MAENSARSQADGSCVETRQESYNPRVLYTTTCPKEAGLDELAERVREVLAGVVADLEREGFWRVTQTSEDTKGEDSFEKNYNPNSLAVDGRSTLLAIVLRLVCGLIGRCVAKDVSLTIVREPYHIDPIYRDCYYSCYSKQHSNTLRYSQRLCFFVGAIDAETLLMGTTEFLQERFIGCVVLNPVAVGSVGRTLLDPRYLYLGGCSTTSGKAAFVRNVPFRIGMMGRRLSVDSFPWRSQDGVMLRCAEVTLINLIEYYANAYKEYAFVLGSQIHDYEASFLNERTIPAKGISYLTASRILSTAGFLPRLHATSLDDPKSKRFRRALHHYIESGIPVAVNVSAGVGKTGHSLLCVGHGSADRTPRSADAIVFRDTRELSAVSSDEVLTPEKTMHVWRSSRSCEMYLSADFYSTYAVIDDNQVPFCLRPFDQLSLYGNMDNLIMLVALHGRIMLDSYDAEDCMIQVLADSKMGVFNWADEEFTQNDGRNQLVLRLFLASAGTFKEKRLEGFRADGCLLRASAYASIPFPHFVWVGELYRYDAYQALARGTKERALGEVVLDATFGRNKDIDNAVVLWNYPKRVGYSLPDGSRYIHDATEGNVSLVADEYRGIVPFDGNLRDVG